MSWVYRQPHTEWFYGRDRLVPLGAPPSAAIEVPAGDLMFAGETPAVTTEQPTGTHIPHVIPYLMPLGGVHHTTFRVAYRVHIISEATGPATSGVEINAPAGVASFVGEVANLGNTKITVPLGNFTMDGQIPVIPGGTPFFEGLRRSVGRLLK